MNKVCVEVRTPQQAAAIANEAGLAEREVRKLLEFICKASSTWSVIAVAHRLGPKQAALAFAQHQERMTGEQAVEILKVLPQTKAYGPTREGLVRKILRIPIRVWLGEYWIEEVWGLDPKKFLTPSDTELMRRTVKSARCKEHTDAFEKYFLKPQ